MDTKRWDRYDWLSERLWCKLVYFKTKLHKIPEKEIKSMIVQDDHFGIYVKFKNCNPVIRQLVAEVETEYGLKMDLFQRYWAIRNFHLNSLCKYNRATKKDLRPRR